jgi:hypothetical protein
LPLNGSAAKASTCDEGHGKVNVDECEWIRNRKAGRVGRY